MARIRACTLCAAHLPLGPRPVLQASRTSRLLVTSQAPGRKVHESGVPFNDVSGNRLREWMGIDRETFYDAAQVAIIPMGFCYPGTGKGGDLPPRPECAPTWHPQLLPRLTQLQLTLAIGQYALVGMLGKEHCAKRLTDTVRAWREHLARASVLPLPHPSPRNKLWMQRNPWFEAELLPVLRERVAAALAQSAPRVTMSSSPNPTKISPAPPSTNRRSRR
ncbi:MAG: uracil-DNA glycosylase family protein [Rhodanobacter sp.]|nr:MAG: uracil-DNA glycosylase family protein [Rhodanobacter sp.]TAM15189.1 MAG: uracil-DNA glycosylase family protein [Rhodanobacter sp.]TAM36660.1 MAG: uracil-DNA glycosylase family protein [Rhodanobacter sp.]